VENTSGLSGKAFAASGKEFCFQLEKGAVFKWNRLLFQRGKDFCFKVEKTSVSKWKKLIFPSGKDFYFQGGGKRSLSSPVAFTDKKENKFFLIYKEIQRDRVQSHI
jgi:hypothetical protein